MTDKPTIAVLGGTGKEGSGLAFRWAYAGYPIVIGSRRAEKAEEAAKTLLEVLPDATISGMDNLTAAEQGDIVVLSVPYRAHAATLQDVKAVLAGKTLVDVTVPLKPPKVTLIQLPDGRTAAEEAQAIVGEGVNVVSAFQNVSAVHLKDIDYKIDCDVLVTGNDTNAKATVIELVEAAGMRGIDGGPLANAIIAESLTPMLIGINKKYGVKSSGIRITQID